MFQPKEVSATIVRCGVTEYTNKLVHYEKRNINGEIFKKVIKRLQDFTCWKKKTWEMIFPKFQRCMKYKLGSIGFEYNIVLKWWDSFEIYIFCGFMQFHTICESFQKLCLQFLAYDTFQFDQTTLKQKPFTSWKIWLHNGLSQGANVCWLLDAPWSYTTSRSGFLRN